MPDRMQDGQQPEALRSLKSAAKAGSQKPQDQGLEARGDTAPISASPEQEQDAAAKVLSQLLSIHRLEYLQFPDVGSRFQISPYCRAGTTEDNLRNKVECGDQSEVAQ